MVKCDLKPTLSCTYINLRRERGRGEGEERMRGNNQRGEGGGRQRGKQIKIYIYPTQATEKNEHNKITNGPHIQREWQNSK